MRCPPKAGRFLILPAVRCATPFQLTESRRTPLLFLMSDLEEDERETLARDEDEKSDDDEDGYSSLHTTCNTQGARC